jgi:ribonuclease-3
LSIYTFIHSFIRKQKVFFNGESEQLDSLSHQISYQFTDTTLLKQALTHCSVCQDKKKKDFSNERLEFLGDAVLGLVVTDELFCRFPEDDEGRLTKAKSYIVSREVLSKQAKKMELGQYVLLSNGEEKSGGRYRQSILADAFEAVIGAIYIDGGLEAARQFVQKHLLDNIDSLLTGKFHHNYKSWLLETVQAKGESVPEYHVILEKGPDHHKEFTVEVVHNGKALGKGVGPNKKKAEQKAAYQALQKLGILSRNKNSA